MNISTRGSQLLSGEKVRGKRVPIHTFGQTLIKPTWMEPKTIFHTEKNNTIFSRGNVSQRRLRWMSSRSTSRRGRPALTIVKVKKVHSISALHLSKREGTYSHEEITCLLYRGPAARFCLMLVRPPTWTPAFAHKTIKCCSAAKSLQRKRKKRGKKKTFLDPLFAGWCRVHRHPAWLPD